jgi:hypothetical protein
VALKTSKVYRCLEKKTLVFGFEILDLFVVFAVLAILNLIFKGIHYKFFLTWVPAILIAVLLRIGKAGKPENYLLHLARYQMSPFVFSAFPLAPRRVQFISPKKRKSI